MDNFFEKISKKFIFLKDPRVKFLGCFLIIIGFVGETVLRKISHFLASELLLLVGRDISEAGSIIDNLFAIGAPIIFIYTPVTIVLWLIIRDGFQKLDWVFGPILIGILLKGGVYGIVSLRYQTDEFWQLAQHDVSDTFLWCSISIFLISSLVGLAIWFKEIL